jgi:hypothetical protein
VLRLASLLVPLLFLAVYLWDGIRRAGGALKQRASTFTSRLTGMRTQETATTEGCSSLSTPGAASAGQVFRVMQLPGSNYYAHFSFGSATEAHGGNGPQRLRSVV